MKDLFPVAATDAEDSEGKFVGFLNWPIDRDLPRFILVNGIRYKIIPEVDDDEMMR